ncbi:hypothetical protein [Gimesia chilikensis]|uniref:hypothetical protein n=1 Tax=Gimesia chilikensis TaxID=2605989 RepID=UPI001E56CD24|nr:hypothetical protein [Gimesia chilikensis]
MNLGELEAQFRPSRLHQAAGYIMVVLIFGCGSYFLIYCATKLIRQHDRLPGIGGKGETLFSLGFGCVFGIGMMVASIFLLRWLRSVASLSVFLGENGFCVIRDQRVEVYTWDQIRWVLETVSIESPPLLVPPLNRILPKTTSRSFIIYRYDGTEFGFDRSYLKDHYVFADLVKQKTDQLGIFWKIVEVRD